MPATYRTGGTSGHGAASTWNLTRPALADGDFVVLWAATDTAHDVNTNPSGFTYAGGAKITSDNADTDLSAWYKRVAVASGEAAWSIVWAANEAGIAGMIYVAGSDPTSPLGNYTPTNATANSTATAAAAQTPDVDGACIVAGFGSDPAGAVTGSSLSDGTERVNGNNGALGFVYGMTLDQATAATATPTVTFSAADRYPRFSLWVRPAATAAGSLVPVRRTNPGLALR